MFLSADSSRATASFRHLRHCLPKDHGENAAILLVPFEFVAEIDLVNSKRVRDGTAQVCVFSSIDCIKSNQSEFTTGRSFTATKPRPRHSFLDQLHEHLVPRVSLVTRG